MTKLTYNEYLDVQTSIADLIILMDESIDVFDSNGLLTEGKIEDTLKKAGFKLHKSRGLIKYLTSAGSGVVKLMIAAIRGDKTGVQNIISSVKKEDVVDFLLKLDMATLHIVTGPIHFINAVTGWDLEANIAGHKPATNLLNLVSKLIGQIKHNIGGHLKLSNTKKKKYHGYLTKLEADLA